MSYFTFPYEFPQPDEPGSDVDLSIRLDQVQPESERLASEAQVYSNGAQRSFARAERTRQAANYLVPIVGKTIVLPYCAIQKGIGDRRGEMAKKLYGEARDCLRFVQDIEQYMRDF